MFYQTPISEGTFVDYRVKGVIHLGARRLHLNLPFMTHTRDLVYTLLNLENALISTIARSG